MKINRKRGFTLIELIVVVTVLAILAAVAVPFISGYTGKASSAVCLENRNMLIRMFNIHKITHPDDDFDTFFQQEFDEDTLCPNDGVYEYADGSLTCSYHGDGVSTGGSGPSGTVELPEGHSFQATASWEDVMDVIDEIRQSNPWGGLSLAEGFVFYDETDYYILKRPAWLTPEVELSTSDDFVKILTDRLIQPADWLSGDVYVEPGVVKVDDNGVYHVWIKDFTGNGYWDRNNVNLWREVRSDWDY